jgi:hypothetical protein
LSDHAAIVRSHDPHGQRRGRESETPLYLAEKDYNRIAEWDSCVCHTSWLGGIGYGSKPMRRREGVSSRCLGIYFEENARRGMILRKNHKDELFITW